MKLTSTRLSAANVITQSRRIATITAESLSVLDSEHLYDPFLVLDTETQKQLVSRDSSCNFPWDSSRIAAGPALCIFSFLSYNVDWRCIQQPSKSRVSQMHCSRGFVKHFKHCKTIFACKFYDHMINNEMVDFMIYMVLSK